MLRSRALAVLAVCLICPPAVFADADVRKQIDALVLPFAEAGHFSGVVLAARDGDVVYERAFGFANAEHDVPNRPGTRAVVASITKSMTVVVLSRLVETGTLALDDKVSRFLPRFPRGDEITVEMLARHRSGIPHRVMDAEMESVPHTTAGMAEKIAEAKLEFEPGSAHLYSSAGYTLLTRILEIASGQPYAELLRKHVFTPAGMKESLEFDSDAVIERLADDYLLGPAGSIGAPLKDYSFLAGAGSVVSTAADIHRFGTAVISGAYGDLVKSNVADGEVFRSNGSTNGYRAYVKVDGGNNYEYVVLSNLASGANDVIIDGLDKVMKGEAVAAPRVLNPKIVASRNSDMSTYLGSYRREGSSSGGFEVKLEGDQLVAGDIRLYPTGSHCFVEYKYYGEVCFAGDQITWASPGVTSKWNRIAAIEEVAPGTISTAAIEDGVEVLADGSLIVSRRDGEWGAMPSQPSSLFLYRRRSDGSWSAPERLFADRADVSDATISPDGSRLVFTSERDLWMSSRTAAGWGEPVRLGSEINSPAVEMGAHFGPDGSLWFSSMRSGGQGSGDIWRARFAGGRFEAAQPVEAINSEHGEWNVMAAGQYVIFEGSGRATNVSRPGDLYISWRNGEQWTAPQNLREINTTGSDLAARLSPDGEWLYFVSSGREGSGQADIYRIDARVLRRYAPHQ